MHYVTVSTRLAAAVPHFSLTVVSVHRSMSVATLFTSALGVVVNDVILYEGEFPYLPGNVRTQLGRVMARRGLLTARNMPLVSSPIVVLLSFVFLC